MPGNPIGGVDRERRAGWGGQRERDGRESRREEGDGRKGMGREKEGEKGEGGGKIMGAGGEERERSLQILDQKSQVSRSFLSAATRTGLTMKR